DEDVGPQKEPGQDEDRHRDPETDHEPGRCALAPAERQRTPLAPDPAEHEQHRDQREADPGAAEHHPPEDTDAVLRRTVWMQNVLSGKEREEQSGAARHQAGSFRIPAPEKPGICARYERGNSRVAVALKLATTCAPGRSPRRSADLVVISAVMVSSRIRTRFPRRATERISPV